MFAQGTKLEDLLSAEEITLRFHLFQCVSRLAEILETRTLEAKLDPPEGRFLLGTLALSRDATEALAHFPRRGRPFSFLPQPR